MSAPTERETPGAEVVKVDQDPAPRTVYGTITKWETAELRPVFPAWIRNRDERRQVIRLVAARVGTGVARHAVRLPLYATLALWYSPRGLQRATRRATDALFDGEGRPLRRHALEKRDTETYLKLAAQRRRHTRARTPAAVLIGLTTVAGVVTVLLAPGWLQLLAGAAVVAALGKIGEPADRPIMRGALVQSETLQPPTSEATVNALRSLGGALGAKDAKITFAEPIRVDGPGWRADIDLPLGVTALHVMDKRFELASGLRRPVGCVWPEPDHAAHAGRLVLWVGRQDMARAKPAVHPLRRGGTCDFFEPVPFGVDQRGRPVRLPMAETNTLIGSLPGAGKTAAVRSLLVGPALDPTVELHVWELKGSGDLESFERIAHVYGSGVDDETIGECAADLEWLRDEVGRRAGRVKELRRRNRDLVPDSKVTRELANRRGLGLHPIVFPIDECQELFAHPEYGKAAGEAATAVIKRGRAFGVHLLLATQRPDKDSLPTGVSANVGTRFCLRVMTWRENDMVLGGSAHEKGIRATTLRPSDRGIGYLVGASDEAQVVRTYYLDAGATDSIVARAHLARERAGLLTGQAAGEVVDRGETVDFLDDVRTVLAHIEVIHTEDLLVRLGELRPHVYGAWTPEQLAAAFKPHAIGPRQVSIEGRNRNGYRLAWVLEALQRRELET